MSSMTKRFRSVLLTVVAVASTNYAISFTGKSGVATVPDMPKPRSGVATVPDMPKPRSGVATVPDMPKPRSGVATVPDMPKP